MKYGKWKPTDKIGSVENVFVASDGTPLRVAVKTLPPKLRQSKAARTRFIDEIKLLLRISGKVPGVIRLIDHSSLDALAAEELWFAMELCTELPTWINKNGNTTANCVRLMAEAAETLATLHAMNIAHRDIKPQNLLVRRDGSIVVADFGIADFPEKTGITQHNAKLGPLHYIAPEMLEAKGVDARPADVYSLAKVLWVILSGMTFPLPGHQHLGEPALSLSAYVADPLARQLDPLLSAATHIDPMKRPTMQDFGDELRSFLAPKTSSTEPDLSGYKGRVRKVMQEPARLQEQSLLQMKEVTEVLAFATPVLYEFCRRLENIGQSIDRNISCGNSEAAILALQPQLACRELRCVALIRGGSTRIAMTCIVGVQNIENDRLEAASALLFSVEGQPALLIAREKAVVISGTARAQKVGEQLIRVLDQLPNVLGMFCEWSERIPPTQLPSQPI